jgi:hypothetical protein
MRKPYLVWVTKEVIKLRTPSAMKPASKTIWAENKSESRPAKRRNAEKQSE